VALFFSGKTICAICGKPVHDTEDPVLFPPFVPNRRDLLLVFNDAVVHRACLEAHPRGDEAVHRIRQIQVQTGPGKRKCVVCSQQILDPDDYFGTAYLAPDGTRVGQFNYLHVHRSHFAQWERADDFRRAVEAYVSSDAWDGPTIVFDPLPRFLPKRP
jgi:hypothetical protein